MRIKHLKSQLLLALLDAYRALTDDSDTQLDIYGITRNMEIGEPKRSLRLCADDFVKDGLITISEFNTDGAYSVYYCRLTAKGIERAEEIEDQIQEEMEAWREIEDSESPNDFDISPDSQTLDNETFRNTINIGNAPEPIPEIISPPVPAADRYVSVKDNQLEFNEIANALTVIKNEFATDHYKQINSTNIPAVIAEIEAFELQIESKWISRSAAQNLVETLKYIETICVSSAATLTAITVIIGSLKLLGLM